MAFLHSIYTRTKISNMKRLLLCLTFIVISYSFLQSQGTLKAEYYNGIDFEQYVDEQTVSKIDFYWDRYAPMDGVDPNSCSVRYTGQLQSPRSGNVFFTAYVDDGIRVWLNDTLLINNWRLNDHGFSEGKLYMEANTKYDLKIEYFNALNEAELRLLWKLPEDPKQNWLSKWWYGDEPVVVPAQYFAAPIEKEISVEEVLEPEPDLVAKSPKKPKAKPKLKVSAPKKEPVVVLPAKPIVKAYEEYIPKNIEFNKGRSKILEISYDDLNKLAGFLKRNSERKLKIEGHTDMIGDEVKNQILSERRAKAVAAYLLKHGVQSEQIVSAIGYGGSKPLIKSDGTKYTPENRRVEFIVE